MLRRGTHLVAPRSRPVAAERGGHPGRRLGVAICGRNSEPTNCLLLEQAPLPARALIAAVTVDGVQLQVASYHAPPGVSWKILKPRQAVLFARWLAATNGPVIFGADGNTPVLDAIDFKNSRTHWHSGSLSLHGEPGDDLLFGPDKIHPLDDALRLWLKQHPDELDRLAAERPQGPLAVSYRTGRRKNSPGTDRRFDAVWVSPQFLVTHVHYPYEDSCTAGSDHSAVVVDLTMSGS